LFIEIWRHFIQMNSDFNDARVLDSTPVPLAKLELFEMKLQNIIFLNENLVKRNNELNRKFLDLRTTLHGTKYLTMESNAVKIIWTVFIMFAISIGAYYIISNLESYYSYPVITNINIRTDQKTLFPAITLCSINENFRYNLSDIILGNL